MRKAGNTQQQIASILGYFQSTIGKELTRTCGRRGYRPKQVHEPSSLPRRFAVSFAYEHLQLYRVGSLWWNALSEPAYQRQASLPIIETGLIAGCRSGGHLLSLYERKSRLGKLVGLDSKDVESTAEAIIIILKGLCVHTITYDNGLDFSGH